MISCANDHMLTHPVPFFTTNVRSIFTNKNCMMDVIMSLILLRHASTLRMIRDAWWCWQTPLIKMCKKIEL